LNRVRSLIYPIRDHEVQRNENIEKVKKENKQRKQRTANSTYQ
jgi:hypothetical protein